MHTFQMTNASPAKNVAELIAESRLIHTDTGAPMPPVLSLTARHIYIYICDIYIKDVNGYRHPAFAHPPRKPP